jgi:hypothetical protein
LKFELPSSKKIQREGTNKMFDYLLTLVNTPLMIIKLKRERNIRIAKIDRKKITIYGQNKIK